MACDCDNDSELNSAMAGAHPVVACEYARRLAARSDAFRRQVEFDQRELLDDGFPSDPFGEGGEAAGCHGLKQRFPDRVLVMASDKCFMNCRHCTRKWMLGGAEVVSTDDELAACVEYVKARPAVRDVLVSGGDPLVLDNRRVEKFISAFASLPQVDVVRLCTRAPCVNPGRIDDELVALLSESGKVWVNTQFNHADELTPEATAACRCLVRAGMPVSCQTVLMRGINDTTGALLDLFRALQRAGVRPYYVFQCDPVRGLSHLRVDLETAKRLEKECAESIGGLGLPRFVVDLPGAKRKIPIGDLPTFSGQKS